MMCTEVMFILQFMANKKFPGDEEGFQKLQQLILEGCGPKEVKITVRNATLYSPTVSL